MGIRRLSASQRRLVSTIVGQYGIWASNLLIPLAIAPYLARVLGPDGLGLYAFWQAVGAYPLLWVEFGFGVTGTRAIAGAADEASVSDGFARVTAAKVVLAGVMVGAVASIAPMIPELRAHPILLWLVVTSAVANGLHPDWYYRGRERLLRAAAMTILVKMAAVPAILVFVREPSHLPRLMGILAGTSVLASAGLLAHTGELRRFRWPRWCKIQETISEGSWLFLAVAGQTASSVVGPFILKTMASPADLGYYYVASRIQGPCWAVLSPMLIGIFPRIVRRMRGAPGSAGSLAIRITLVATLVSTAMAAVLGALAGPLVRVFAGAEYSQSVSTLRVLALIIPLIAANSAVAYLIIIPMGREKVMLPITLAGVGVTTIAAAGLVPHCLHNGLAWALVAGEGTKLLMSVKAARRQCHVASAKSVALPARETASE